MGVRIASTQSNSLITPTLVTTAETAIFTVGPLSLVTDSATVMLQWFVMLTGGTASTGVKVRLHRSNGLAGSSLMSPGQQDITGAANVNLAGSYIDSPAGGADLFYTLSLQLVAATGNGNVADGCLIAFVL